VTGTLVGDEQLHAAAIITRLNAILPASVRAYDSDDVPDVKPAAYVEVLVSRRFGAAPARGTASTTRAGWRVAARVVDQTSVPNARRTANFVRTALEFYRLSVGGKTSTPVQFETAEAIGPDDGWWSGLTAYTYAI